MTESGISSFRCVSHCVGAGSATHAARSSAFWAAPNGDTRAAPVTLRRIVAPPSRSTLSDRSTSEVMNAAVAVMSSVFSLRTDPPSPPSTKNLLGIKAESVSSATMSKPMSGRRATWTVEPSVLRVTCVSGEGMIVDLRMFHPAHPPALAMHPLDWRPARMASVVFVLFVCVKFFHLSPTSWRATEGGGAPAKSSVSRRWAPTRRRRVAVTVKVKLPCTKPMLPCRPCSRLLGICTVMTSVPDVRSYAA
mmetsp:Transcript_132065/g.228922  ORF Transcript_132065/g.228922 Transcript_132065/m.228922 type:complete len:249 (+) Transcript_132065:1169-1915(+)